MEKKQPNKLTTVLLLVLLLASLGYAFYSNSEHNALQAELEAEKSEIKSELDNLIVMYDAKIAENTTLSTKLSAAREDIISYRDSLKAEKKASYSAIKRYKNRVYSLQKKNKELFSQVEELTTQNEKLNEEVLAAKGIIEVQEVAGAELVLENELLSAKVAVASELDVSGLLAESMRKKSSGLKATTKAKNTDAFKISFTIGENSLASRGNKVCYVIISGPEGKVVMPKDKIAGEDSEEVYYSDTTVIDYKNVETDVILFTDVNREENKKGVYTIKAILDGKTIGESSVTLK